MSNLSKKIDFAVIMSVKNANPNGDPLSGNRPRTDYEGLGEITDVCLKRKIRDRLIERYSALKKKENGEEKGQAVFVQSDDNKEDNFPNLRTRAESILGKLENIKDIRQKACNEWFDVRTFGQIFPFKGSSKKGKKTTDNEEGDTKGVSIAIRGPVTIQSAFSKESIESLIISSQIVKSTSLEGDGVNRQKDQIGTKHRISKEVVYVTYGSMNPQLAEKTGFSDADAKAIKDILPKLFENDASSARPEGSMRVLKVIWWQHGGKMSSAKVHGSLHVNPDGTYNIDELEGLSPEIIDGF